MCRIKSINNQIINKLNMKLKLEITDKERHILYRVLAVVLFIANGAMMWYSAPELDKIVPNYLKEITAISMLWIWILTTVALFKHYR
jgi:hypothetical protein